MKQFPYITDYMNETFRKEKQRFDYIFIRPILLILYFFLRCFAFPFKFLFHRKPWGWEGYCIDGVLAFGLKRFASYNAVELLIRHVQIEPILYRYLLTGHDYEDNDDYSKEVLEINEKYSFGWFGATNVVMFVVFAITIFADLQTTVKALNSFDSDSIMLWALKHIYEHDPDVLIDLDFYMQVYSNRSHYNSSAFFSDPSQYLAYHIVFDEFAYHTLRNRTPTD